MTPRRHCPYCDMPNITNGHGSAAMCQDCAAQGPDVRRTRTVGAERSEALTAAWNRRPAEDRLQAEITEAMARLRAAGADEPDAPKALLAMIGQLVGERDALWAAVAPTRENVGRYYEMGAQVRGSHYDDVHEMLVAIATRIEELTANVKNPMIQPPTPPSPPAG